MVRHAEGARIASCKRAALSWVLRKGQVEEREGKREDSEVQDT